MHLIVVRSTLRLSGLSPLAVQPAGARGRAPRCMCDPPPEFVQPLILQPSVIRLGVLLILFDVYLTWARIEKALQDSPAQTLAPPPPLPASLSSLDVSANGTAFTSSSVYPREGTPDHRSFIASQPIPIQYLFFLALCTLETISFHFPIRILLSIRFPRPISSLVPFYPHSALISTALFVSSFTKLFPLLLLIWKYDLPSSASAVSWAVIINNVAALEILLGCGYVRAAFLAAIAAVCRAGVGWVSLPVDIRTILEQYQLTLDTAYLARCWRWRRRCCCRRCRDRRLGRGLEKTDGELRTQLNVFATRLRDSILYTGETQACLQHCSRN